MDRLDDVMGVDLRDDLAGVDLEVEEVEEVEDGGGWWRWMVVEEVVAAALYLEQRVDALQARRLQPVEAEVVAGVGRRLDVEVELHELTELHLEEVDVLDPPAEVEGMEVVKVEVVVAEGDGPIGAREGGRGRDYL